METTLKGNAWVYGDNVDTDVIIPARYLVTSDERSLAAHCMEDIDETYAKGVSKGDVITAGNNFGCGSSREHASREIPVTPVTHHKHDGGVLHRARQLQRHPAGAGG